MKNNTAIGGNMILTTTTFRSQKSFSLIPVTNDCPYVECMFDPETKILAGISKVSKQSYHMVPKLDDNGDIRKLKLGKREGGKTIQEQRVLVDTFSEFYISEKEEIINFVNLFAHNAKEFDILKYWVETVKDPEREREVDSIGNIKIPKGFKATVQKKKEFKLNTL